MKETTIIIGASIAGTQVCSTLIKNNYEGKIILFDKNKEKPYNPYPLTKDWMREPGMTPPYLQEDNFYKDHGVDLRLETKVTSFDPIKQTVLTDKQETIHYDKLVIATGSRLKTLWAPHEDADGIFYLRSFESALAIKQYAKDVQDIVLVGGGFISLELASTFSQMGKNVTILNRSEYPLGNVLGDDVSKRIMKMHMSHGVKVRCSETITSFNVNKNNAVKSVITTLDETLPAQMVILGIGVSPNLSLSHPYFVIQDGAIVVDTYNQTSIPNVFACGDIAAWPYHNEIINMEHWENAYYQGISVAKNILNKESNPYTTLPYFWTDQYDQTYEYLGYTKSWHKTVLRGSLADRAFTLAYVDENNIPLGILFANKLDTRKEVKAFLLKQEPLNEEKFQNLDLKLTD